MSIFDKKLILVVGKGGVGRSTVAASIASKAASQGKRTLLFQHDAVDRHGGWFGKSPVGSDITQLAPNLFAVNATANSALEEYGIMVLRWRRVYKMVFENRVTKSFLRAIPGLNAYSILGKAWFHTTETKKDGSPLWDCVVFDMAASGHSLTMLKIPQVILSTVPEGPLTRDARKVRSLLTNTEETAVVMVTLPEDMPTNEAIELQDKLRKESDIQVTSLVINQTYPPTFSSDDAVGAVLRALEASEISDDANAVYQHASLLRKRGRMQDEYVSILRKNFHIPTAQVARRFSEVQSAEIADISAELASQLT